jgi:hypothetical protein
VLQVKEQEIKKQFRDAVKIQQKQYKLLRDAQVAKLSKSEQKEVVKKLKEDQIRRLAMLGQQYDSAFSEMVEHQNVRFKYGCFFSGVIRAFIINRNISVMPRDLHLDSS